MKSRMLVFMIMIFLAAISLESFAQERRPARTRKTQEVNFSELSLDGKIRNPDGAFLVERQNIKFQPLYDIQKDFDEKLRESIHYVR